MEMPVGQADECIISVTVLDTTPKDLRKFKVGQMGAGRWEMGGGAGRGDGILGPCRKSR